MTSWQINRTFLLIFAGFFLAGGSHLSAQNLVTNGGFESGLTGWTNNTSGGAGASFSLEAVQPYEGARAMKIAVTNPGAQLHNVQTLGPTFTLAVGTPTSITFRARASVSGVKVRFVMQDATYNNKEFTLSTSWQWFSWNHTTTEATPRLRMQYRSGGTVWLDDISLVVNAAAGTTTRISSDTTIRHQTMDGIGGSIAFNTPDYEALSATKKNEIENLLYVDCGIDIVRLRTGNSDALNNELAMRAQRNGAKTLLTCWSPPASLKSNNSIVSGTLRIVSGNYDYAGFANWWYDRLSASNWMHDFISIQNEPSFDPGDKETCRFFANETVPATTSGSASYRLAMEAVYNKIKNEPKRPQFIAVDAETHSAFNSITPTVSGLSYVNHLGFHNYGTNDFAGVKSRYNGNRGWMTEWGADPDILDNWLVLAINIHETLVNANASAYLAWRMVHGNNTGQVWAMIGVENGQYQVQNSFYSVKHFAKHISSGDQRNGKSASGGLW
jgi:O-glycosyl hydrolase